MCCVAAVISDILKPMDVTNECVHWLVVHNRNTAHAAVLILCLFFFPQDVTLTDGCSVSASLPTSPSSMTNQYRFEEESDTRDIFVTVDNPESHVTALETFITYRVVTKVCFSNG